MIPNRPGREPELMDAKVIVPLRIPLQPDHQYPMAGTKEELATLKSGPTLPPFGGAYLKHKTPHEYKIQWITVKVVLGFPVNKKLDVLAQILHPKTEQ